MLSSFSTCDAGPPTIFNVKLDEQDNPFIVPSVEYPYGTDGIDLAEFASEISFYNTKETEDSLLIALVDKATQTLKVLDFEKESSLFGNNTTLAEPSLTLFDVQGVEIQSIYFDAYELISELDEMTR